MGEDCEPGPQVNTICKIAADVTYNASHQTSELYHIEVLDSPEMQSAEIYKAPQLTFIIYNLKWVPSVGQYSCMGSTCV